MSRGTIWALIAVWALAMLLSGLAMTAEPTGDGFTRGLNRLTGFLSWQLAGMVVAAILYFGSRGLPRRDWQRRLARLPGIVALLLVLLILAWIAAASLGIGSGAPEAPPGPATAPAEPAQPTTSGG